MYGLNGLETIQAPHTQTQSHSLIPTQVHLSLSTTPFVIFGDIHGRGLAPVVMDDSQGDNTPKACKGPTLQFT